MRNLFILVFLFISSIFGFFGQTDVCSSTVELLPTNVICNFDSESTPNLNTNGGIGCGLGNPDDDVWYRFIATNASHIITVDGNANFDAVIGVFSNCTGSVVSGGSCVNATGGNGIETQTLTGLAIGATYFINVYDFGNGGGDYQICVSTPVQVPVNNECVGSINVPVSSGPCSFTRGSINFATASAQVNGCAGTADDDVWYSFVATAVSVTISLTNVTGSTTDLNHSVFSGSCTAPGLAIVCSNPNSSIVNGLTIGNTYFVRVYSATGTAGQNTFFDICIQSNGICGTPTTQDFCTAPALLTQGPGSFSANTSGSYTTDIPANLLAAFCGSIENNSWFQFTASATTEIFNFSNVAATSPGSCPNGVQAVVLNVTEDVNGCCTNFASVSNCFEPGSAVGGLVTATGLTVGNQYVLMVDGNSGSICDFTISGWSATGIIPLGVDYKDFYAVELPEFNALIWETSIERDCDYFDVLRSFDGLTFEKIGTIDGQGTKNTLSTYRFEDSDLRSGTTYYQLKQTDLNGSSKNSDMIVLNRKMDEKVFLYPNPTSKTLNFELNNSDVTKISISNLNGQIIYSFEIEENGFQKKSIDISEFDNGHYLVYVIQNNQLDIKSFIKL